MIKYLAFILLENRLIPHFRTDPIFFGTYLPTYPKKNTLMMHRMLLLLVLAGACLSPLPAMADISYLQANKTFGQPDDDRSIWWNHPAAGTNTAESGAGFAGNTFVLNGFTYQTENTTATGSFDGTMVSDSESTINYAIVRDSGGAFIMNTPAPLVSATRPFIWVKASERVGLLNKIATNDWAASLENDLIARVVDELTAYESDPDAYLRELPVDWTHTPTPIFYTTEAAVRVPWGNKLNTALDCAILYFLTGDPRYAALAADVLHNSVESLLNTPKGAVPYGGWTFHDGGLLKEARVVGTQMPIIYDFLHAYLQSNDVWNVDEGSSISFSTNNAQTVFETYWQLCRDRGQDDNNWGALMGTCMVLNILALDDVVDRNTALDFYTYTGSSRQDSLATDHSHFDQAAPHAIYPESLQYAGGVVTRDTYHMTLIERYDTNRTLFSEFSLIPESVHRLNQFKFPNGEDYIVFGDGRRLTSGSIDYLSAELIYQHAKRLGRTDLMDFNGGLIAEGLTSGKYDRSELDDYESLGKYNEPLKLLWSDPVITETPVTMEVFQTDTMPYAGIALQRNLSPNGDPDYGLMSFVGGAGHVHSHPSGMNMELYGLGEVLGAKATGKSNEARTFAAGNTVIVNGYSRGDGGWKDFAVNTVQVVAMEPAARQAGVSSNISFSCSSSVDDKGNGAEADQQRTMAIIRTSPTTGYYVDLFRSDSSLGGEYHDYVYHNIGDSLTVENYAGTPLTLSNDPSRFQNDTDEWNSPGWGFWTDAMVSATETNSVRARFTTQPSGAPEPIYMDLHIPGEAAREYATALAPAVGDISDPYDDLPIPTLAIRKTGEAWDAPFATIFEPHLGTNGSIQNVTTLEQEGVVVGMKVESLVNGSNITQYVISNPGANDIYADPSIGLSFTGRFAVVTDRPDGSSELYIGEGSYLAYNNLSVSVESGGNTQASVLFDVDGPTDTTANDPVIIRWNDTVFSKTFYLAGDMPLNPNPGSEDRSWWWDDPTNGLPMSEGESFSSSRFDLNGYTFKSKNTTGSRSFAGTLVKDESAGNIMIYAKTYSLAGLDWSADGGAFKSRQDDMDLSIADLRVDNTMIIRVNSTEKNLDLQMASLTGDGTIQFGEHNTAGEDGDSIWGLDIDNSAFAGIIEVNVGNLRFDDTLALTNATLSILAGSQLTSVIISNDAAFAAMTFGATPVADGEYTAGDLNTLLNTTRFSGSGTLTVGTPPAGPTDADNEVSNADFDTNFSYDGTSASGTFAGFTDGSYTVEWTSDLVVPFAPVPGISWPVLGTGTSGGSGDAIDWSYDPGTATGFFLLVIE